MRLFKNMNSMRPLKPEEFNRNMKIIEDAFNGTDIGSRTYTELNYVTTGETVTASLDVRYNGCVAFGKHKLTK